MKENTTYEVCPFCEEEVELNAELMVQTCPHCGRRIVTCSMCRACDTEDNYCTHCCLDYQARVENQENDWRYKGYLISFEPSKSNDGIMATAIRIADGKAMFCVYGTDERDARIEAENKIDTREMAENDEPEIKEYKVPFLRHQWCDVVVTATSPEEAVRKAQAIFTEGHDGFVDWEDVDAPELDKEHWENTANTSTEAPAHEEPFIVMTREMSLLGETIQDITLSAWPIVWDNNKYDQDSREVLEMLRDWAVEFENWWYGHDQDWRDNNSYYIEVEQYAIRKSKEYVKELQERLRK